MIVTYKFNIS